MNIRTLALAKIYRVGSKEIRAVDNVSLDVKAGIFTAIVGPSGSGKTTLLNLIGLNDCPTSGKVFLDNNDASILSGRERRRIRLLRIGFVFQTFNLLPTLNALENVELPMALAHRPPHEQKENARMLLSEVGLNYRLYHRPKELSVGEMQRVAIARALANDPELIVGDEPTGELDSKQGREIINLLQRIGETRDKTIILATHDMKVVEAADRIYKIQDGKIEPD